ncbi:MAG: hypothetical protein C5B44_05210 [Acidobacteria bacterium]|nr:MAG: hypothetical protein C5B44_05210 [Acidobacteriota bacterium]
MRRLIFAIFATVAVLAGVVFSSQAENVSLRGDYVEVRTASVFAGACHYNGEVTTTGRDAMMAWNVTSGKWQDVDLTGVRVIAIVSSDSNLSDRDTARQSEIIIDSSATRTQALAMMNALKEKYAASLGRIVSIRNAPITFARSGRTFAVATDEAAINVEGMPNDLCCKMPNLVWYTPLVGLENRKVGYTTNARYNGNVVSDSWERAGENSAFYGSFAL